MRTPIVCVAGVLALTATSAGAQTPAELAHQVREAELGFAGTMARRDLAAFATYLADEAVFFAAEAIRGKAAVVAAWTPFFEGEDAPFSWAPETIEVLESGTLAISTGPVLDPQGRRVGTFNSIWRREPDGRWRVVFDKGCPPCDCPPRTVPGPD
jgi:ketosteroid isomerase-like protein